MKKPVHKGLAQEFDNIKPEEERKSSGILKKGPSGAGAKEGSGKSGKKKSGDTFLDLENYCIYNFADDKVKRDPNESENAPVVVEEYEDSNFDLPQV